MLDKYFQAETELLTEQCLDEIETLDDWKTERESYRTQLLEMLGLDPFPARTPLSPVITGSMEHEGLIVERLHFQSLPGPICHRQSLSTGETRRAATSDSLCLRSRWRQKEWGQPRKQNPLPAPRGLVRAARLRLPDDRHDSARRDRRHPPWYLS